MSDSHASPVLRPVEFEILLTLAAGDRHGYAIIQDTAARGGGELETATLYRALRRLVEAGFVRPAPAPRDEPSPDERRRYYGLTAAGRAAARREATRLERLVAEARATRLLSDRGRPA
ncbi:MAG: PadR family transcriptional regulator [Gemmatimonadales bacterium]